VIGVKSLEGGGVRAALATPILWAIREAFTELQVASYA